MSQPTTLLITIAIASMLSLGFAHAQAPKSEGAPAATSQSSGKPDSGGQSRTAPPTAKDEAPSMGNDATPKRAVESKDLESKDNGHTRGEDREAVKERSTKSDAEEPKKGESSDKEMRSRTADEEDDRKGRKDTSKPSESTADDNQRKADDDKGETEANDEERQAGKSKPLSSEQVSKTRQYFDKRRPDVKAVDRDEISVSIGFVVPTTIALYAVPTDVIIITEDCPAEYFLWGDDIVIVDSCTREVVAILS